MVQPLSVMEIHKLAKKSHWSIRLGQPEWSKFTYQRPADDPLKLLGSARHGHQYGALAKLEDELVLVVGDYTCTAMTDASLATPEKLALFPAAMPATWVPWSHWPLGQTPLE